MSEEIETKTLSQDQNDSNSEEASLKEKPLLNQAEIDGLLRAKNVEPVTGLETILNSSKVSYERLPMLEIVLDRFIKMLSSNLRNFFGETVDVSIDQIISTRFGNYMDSIEDLRMLGVFKAPEWEDNTALLVADHDLIYTVIDTLLGGRKLVSENSSQQRTYTSIERNIVRKLFRLILDDLGKAFSPLCEVNFILDRLETTPNFALIVRPVNVAIKTSIRLDMDGRHGIFEFIIPYSTIEPVRDVLLQGFLGEKFGQDSMWEKHLTKELWGTRVPIEGVLDRLSVSLDEVLKWEKGTQIILDAKPDSSVELKCGDLPIGIGKLGSRNGRIAIQVEKSFIQEKKTS